jgi:hypothetical protein
MRVEHCGRSATAAPVLLALRPAARAVALLSSVCAVLCRSCGQRQCVRADWPVPWHLSRVSTAECHHRVGDQLERPRRKRSQRRSELRATIGRGIGWPTTLASEHHGDDHSRCKPSPQHQWRPWPRSCACVLWGDHGFMPSLPFRCGGECAGSARQQHSRRRAHAVPHSGGACVGTRSTPTGPLPPAVGRTLCRTRAMRVRGTARRL